MEIRFFELVEEFNNKLDSISRYLNENEIQLNIKEISYEDEGFPVPQQLIENPNKRRIGRTAHYGNGNITFSLVSSQMIWYLAWLAYLIKENQEDIFNEDDFINRLVRVDKGDDEVLSYKDLYEWDNGDVDSIFLYAMSSLICHEIGHNVFHHPGYLDEDGNFRDLEISRKNELEADSFAVDCVKHISNNSRHDYELTIYGILVNKIAELFIRNKEVHYDTHPDPDTRLQNALNGIDRTPEINRLIDCAKELSETYLERRFV